MADLQSVGFQLAIGCAVLFVTKLLWELCFSPLSAFPGPIVAKFTNIWRAIAASRGDVDTTNIELHRKYGSAVRIGPNCISLSDPKMIRAVYKGAWKKGAWHPSLFLFPIRRVTCTGLMMSFLMANEYRTSSTLKTKTGIINTFGRIRNLWSLNKVLEYEPLIDETLNKLLAKIDSKFVQEGKACPADEWMSYFAWDATANITFGHHYGFIDQEKDVDDLIGASTKVLK